MTTTRTTRLGRAMGRGRARALLAALALSAPSCGRDADPCADVSGTCVALRLEAEGDASADRVRVQFSVEGGATLERVSGAPGGQAAKFPIALGILLGDRSGALTLDATAELAGAAVLRGSTTDTIAAGEHKALTVTLTAATGGPPGLSPAARSGAALAYFPDRQRLVLFGGTGAGGTPLGDTWEYGAATGWQEQPRQGHPAARASALAYDPRRQALVLFGGRGDAIYGDLWLYDRAGTWSQLSPTGTQPAPRHGHGITFDYQKSTLLVFGGYDSADMAAPRNDLFELASGTLTWTARMPGPAMVRTPKLVYEGRAPLLVGADESGATTVKVWRIDTTAGTYTDITVAGADTPSKRSSFSVAFDRGAGELLLFGGQSGTGTGTEPGVSAFGDTYALNPLEGKWLRLADAPQPPARLDAALEYLPETRQVLLLGGREAGAGVPPLADRWGLTAHTWQALP